MAESTEMQALAKISTEVGESQIKITFSSQCIKGKPKKYFGEKDQHNDKRESGSRIN